MKKTTSYTQDVQNFPQYCLLLHLAELAAKLEEEEKTIHMMFRINMLMRRKTPSKL